ncbi:MAG: SurA N-terminal domain-containing protein [Dehalococcoidia bacterium]
MAKTAKLKATAAPRRRRAARDDAEYWNRILIVGGVIAVILLAAGIIGYGYWDTQKRPLGNTVLTVGDISFSLGALERRLDQELPEDRRSIGADLLTYPERVIADMQREALLIQGGSELNINVTDEDIAAEVRTQGGLAETVDAQTYAREYRRQVEESGLKESEYRQKLRADLIEQRARDYFTFLAPNAEPQVLGRWIRADTRETAEDAKSRLAAGEEFTVVADELSLDAPGSTRQGDLEWSPRGTVGQLPQSVEEYLFSAEPNTPSDILEESGLFYIAEVIERDEARELTADQKLQVAFRNESEWLDRLPVTIPVTRNFDQDDALKALNDVL